MLLAKKTMTVYLQVDFWIISYLKPCHWGMARINKASKVNQRIVAYDTFANTPVMCYSQRTDIWTHVTNPTSWWRHAHYQHGPTAHLTDVAVLFVFRAQTSPLSSRELLFLFDPRTLGDYWLAFDHSTCGIWHKFLKSWIVNQWLKMKQIFPITTLIELRNA